MYTKYKQKCKTNGQNTRAKSKQDLTAILSFHGHFVTKETTNEKRGKIQTTHIICEVPIF